MAEALRSPGGLFRRLADFLFGYDYFISYAHADGHVYARRLSEQLEELGFSVFLDARVYVAGDDLQSATRRRIRMSKKLAVVVRPKALESEWVLREIQVCLDAGRMPIAIDVAQTLEQAPDDNPAKALLKDKIYISDSGSGPVDEPAADVAAKLARSFDATRQETLRVRALGAAAVIFAGIAAVAVWQYREAGRNEARAIENERQAIENEKQAVKNAIQFYDFCAEARRQVAIGQEKLETLGQASLGGDIVSQIARDVAQLPDPKDIECGKDPRGSALGVDG